MRLIMSEYRVTLMDGTERIAVRDNSRRVTDDFETVENPIIQVQRTRTNMDVNVPELRPPVFFRTVITPVAAVSGGCIAAPSQFTVIDGTSVVFQAIPGAGFAFFGWFLNAPIFPEDAPTFNPLVPISTDATTVIIITPPAPGQERLIEARFVPVP